MERPPNGITPSASTKDLLFGPPTCGVFDIEHEVIPAASSSSADRAKKFLKGCSCPSSAKGFCSYAELVANKNVDTVKICHAHSRHFQNTMLSLEVGKHVLCDKVFTHNAA